MGDPVDLVVDVVIESIAPAYEHKDDHSRYQKVEPLADYAHPHGHKRSHSDAHNAHDRVTDSKELKVFIHTTSILCEYIWVFRLHRGCPRTGRLDALDFINLKT